MLYRSTSAHTKRFMILICNMLANSFHCGLGHQTIRDRTNNPCDLKRFFDIILHLII